MEEPEQIKDAIRIVWDNKKPILTWSIAVFVITAAASLFLKNYYQATTTFYPASLDLTKPELIFGNSPKEAEFYGTGQDLDRLLTICQSNEIKDQLIARFALYQHYKIDSLKPLAHHKIRKKLNGLMDVVKTKYEAIDLSIEDQDKTLAAQMANATRELVNQSANQLITDRLHKVAEAYQTSITEKQHLLQALNDSLVQLRKKYPIYNIDAQTESLSTIAAQVGNDLAGESARYESLRKNNAPKDTLMYLQARIRGLETQLKSITKSEPGTVTFNLENFNDGMSLVRSLDLTIDRLQIQVNEDRIRHQNTINTAQSGAPSIITIAQAEVPIYKSRPRRSMLVLAATLFALLSLSLYYLLKPYWK